MKKYRLLEMTSEEFARAAGEEAVALVPVASTEELGAYGPLGADVIVAEHVADRIARSAGCILGPVIPVGNAVDMMPWAGTLAVHQEPLQRYYLDVCRSFARHGIRRIFFFTAHLGNLRAVEYCARAMRGDGVLVSQVDWWRAAARAADGLLEDDRFPGGHGGEVIMSVVMAIRPDLVQAERAAPADPLPALERHLPYSTLGGGPFYTYPAFSDFTDTGVWGDPGKAAAEKGRLIIDNAVGMIAEFIRTFKEEPLPESRREERF